MPVWLADPPDVDAPAARGCVQPANSHTASHVSFVYVSCVSVPNVSNGVTVVMGHVPNAAFLKTRYHSAPGMCGTMITLCLLDAFLDQRERWEQPRVQLQRRVTRRAAYVPPRLCRQHARCVWFEIARTELDALCR
eukprot:490524-Rhodomonas_salina.1